MTAPLPCESVVPPAHLSTMRSDPTFQGVILRHIEALPARRAGNLCTGPVASPPTVSVAT